MYGIAYNFSAAIEYAVDRFKKTHKVHYVYYNDSQSKYYIISSPDSVIPPYSELIGKIVEVDGKVKWESVNGTNES